MSNSTIHSSILPGDTRQYLHREYPADLLKFNAYIKPVNSFEEACEIIKKKKLVLGEPAVVPFKYKHDDGSITIELVFGIGSVEVEKPYLKCSITNDILNDAVISGVDDNGQPAYKKLIDILKELITVDNANKIITEQVESALKSEEVINNVTANILNSTTLKADINDKINERLSWRPLSKKLEDLGIK